RLQALIDLHHDEQVLRRLAMALFISQRDDRGKPKDNREQTIDKQHSHDIILLWILIPHAGGSYPRRGGRKCQNSLTCCSDEPACNDLIEGNDCYVSTSTQPALNARHVKGVVRFLPHKSDK